MSTLHPRQALYGATDPPPRLLPVCDHYAGTEPRMRKALALQAELGPVFDLTLDLEDGAPVGGEREHAALVAELLGSAANRFGRVGVRLPGLRHAAFGDALATVLAAARQPAYLMLPKCEGLADLQAAARTVDAAGGAAVPLHALVETHGALADVFALAAHPRVESLSFGLMDFVSAHRGAIPMWAMTAEGQFDHPLVVRAKLEISAACHRHGKVPSHGVVTEFADLAALREAADKAATLIGCTRMWSIHPAQIRPIVQAFAPGTAEVDEAIAVLQAAQAARWAPVRHADRLHDRASYRYLWQVLERAHATSPAGGAQLPAEVRQAWFG